MIFGHSIFLLFFQFIKMVSTGRKKTLNGVPKGYPLVTILGRFGAPGGNVKIMVLYTRSHYFEGWSRSRDTSCAALCTQCFPTRFSGRLSLDFFVDLDSKGGPRGGPRRTHEGPTNQLFGYFFPPASFGDPWGAQSRQNTPKTTKIIPKWTPQ